MIVLHGVYEDYSKSGLFNKKIEIDKIFSFEITKIGNRIRFFVVSPKKYANFLTNQIYAHYNNVEILEVADYLEKIPINKIKVGRISLKKHFYFPIKSFTELQEEASKDTIDPFSSITSALSKSGKYTLNTFQINFVPIKDKSWKNNSEKVLKIL
ncbi:MAG: hypothetical protein LBU14_03575 [Candidatus Peribacteria bacterium]|nr:hypothetical protein [Candidatus Peribacteria bacterium]